MIAHQEIAQARRQDAERLQSAEERFETVVKRLNDMEQAFTAVAAADDTPTLTEHKVRPEVAAAAFALPPAQVPRDASLPAPSAYNAGHGTRSCGVVAARASSR